MCRSSQMRGSLFKFSLSCQHPTALHLLQAGTANYHVQFKLPCPIQTVKLKHNVPVACEGYTGGWVFP